MTDFFENLLNNGELQEKVAELKAENEALIEGLGIANKYVNKYHKTLQEIKEIAEKEYYTIEPEARYITDKILQKISEVTK